MLLQYKIPEGIWVTDPTYGIPDEEGFIMGDPIELEVKPKPMKLVQRLSKKV